MILSLKKFRARDVELLFGETEEDKATSSPQADALRAALQRGPHSFEWIRSTTPLTLTDAEFEQIIDQFPHVFEKTRIVRRGPDGQRIIPGWPGVKLRASGS